MKRDGKVIVVGAGVIGTSIGYYLSREGIDVLILERESVGSGASVCAMGALLLMSHELMVGPHLELGIHSREILCTTYEQIERDAGIDIMWAARPHLALAFDDEEEEWLRRRRIEIEHAVASDWLERDELLRLEPRINPQVQGGCYTDVQSQLDGYRLTLAYTMAMESFGGSVVSREVTGLITAGEQVKGVRVDGQEYHADAVVLAMGPWSRLASSWLGFEVPILPVKGERLMLKFAGEPLAYHLSSPRLGVIFYQADGQWTVGARGGRAFDVDDDHTEWDAKPTDDGLEEMVGWATSLMPCLEGAELVKHVAGIRPVSEDKLPILGAVPGLANLYLASGHGHSGIGLSAVTGTIMADLVLSRTPRVPVDLTPFSPTRFSHNPVVTV